MSFLKILAVGSVAAGLLLLIPVFFIYMASDQEKLSVGGSYSGLWTFQNSMNYLIATILSNLGYVLAVLLITGMVLAAIIYAVTR